jgi:peptidoglycan glycosyltransferase
MAMISAAIANDGVLMSPYLVQTVRDSRFDVVYQASPEQIRRSISARTADQLTLMMVDSVSGPGATGAAAAISGVDVAGKTGTAEWATGRYSHGWFTGFAPADNPRVAVAVVIEEGGELGGSATGGALAAPAARRVMEAVLAQ